jgi:hypothetical protein
MSRKWHYFDGAISLCRKWMYGGELDDTKDDHPENCAACRKLITAHRRRADEVAT